MKNRKDCEQEQKWISYIARYARTGNESLNQKEAGNALRLFLMNLGFNKIVEAYDEVITLGSAGKSLEYSPKGIVVLFLGGEDKIPEGWDKSEFWSSTSPFIIKIVE